jgi:hypothetical protein
MTFAEIGGFFLGERLANGIMSNGAQGFEIANIKFDSEIVILDGPIGAQFVFEALERPPRVLCVKYLQCKLSRIIPKDDAADLTWWYKTRPLLECRVATSFAWAIVPK